MNLLLHFGPGGFVADGPIQAFAVSPDGRRVACARDGNWFDVFDPSGNHIASGRASDPDQIRVLAFSPDGKTLAGGLDHSGTVWLWDAATGEQHLSVSANPAGVRALAFSPDGKRLACGGDNDGTVWVADPAARAAVAVLAPAGAEPVWMVQAVAYHPAGRAVAACGAVTDKSYGVVTLWRTGDRPRPARFLTARRSDTDEWAVAFHPNGRTAYLASNAEVRAVEVATGRVRWRAGCDDNVVTWLAVSADGRFVAAGGDRPWVWVWDADTGKLATLLRAHSEWLVGLAGGDRLFTAGGDRNAREVRAWPWPAAPPRTVRRPRAADPVTLAGDAAAAAFAAIRRLSADPAAVRLARTHLAPVPPVPADAAGRVRSLARQLGSGDFDVRQAASRDLAALGPAVAPELRRALRAAADPEVADRLTEVLREYDRADDVTAARWLEVLERVGTPEAVALVRTVAGGDPDHPRTEDAADTLARMLRK